MPGSDDRGCGPTGLSGALQEAVRARDLALVTLLLESGAEVDDRDEGGMTPLMWAALGGSLPLLELLLSRGADVNAADQRGDTALMRAAGRGRGPVVKLLLARGAKVNAADQDGCTALHIAVRALDPFESLQALLLAGADPEARARDGTTPRDWVELRSDPTEAELILRLLDSAAEA
ncbi:MAG: ankyrin repeat domain-containing protein [Armatimonadota bacterium]